MGLFQKADTGHSFLKAGIMGLAGSGKTYTAASIAIGLVGYMVFAGPPEVSTFALAGGGDPGGTCFGGRPGESAVPGCAGSHPWFSGI